MAKPNIPDISILARIHIHPVLHRVGVSEWGSYNFMHSRGEVRSFLQSAADYWLREYHFDGLRMDARYTGVFSSSAGAEDNSISQADLLHDVLL